jgi:hypothetical protein
MRTGARRIALGLGKAAVRFGAPGRQVVLLHYPVDPTPRSTMQFFDEMFAAGIPVFKETMLEVAAATQGLGAEDLPWSNAFLPPLDAASLYGLIRSRAPSRYVEIGSGNSTIVARQAIRDGNASTWLTSIDPQPREIVDTLCDELVRVPLQTIDRSIVLSLRPGDMLFFDGTHQSFPNSDVTVFFTELLPNLPPEVIVGIHDIYLPDDYPAWAAATLPNEQYLLASLLHGRGTIADVLLPCAYVGQRTELGSILNPLWDRLGQLHRHGGAFWFKTWPTARNGR